MNTNITNAERLRQEWMDTTVQNEEGVNRVIATRPTSALELVRAMLNEPCWCLPLSSLLPALNNEENHEAILVACTDLRVKCSVISSTNTTWIVLGKYHDSFERALRVADRMHDALTSSEEERTR